MVVPVGAEAVGAVAGVLLGLKGLLSDGPAKKFLGLVALAGGITLGYGAVGTGINAATQNLSDNAKVVSPSGQLAKLDLTRPISSSAHQQTCT